MATISGVQAFGRQLAGGVFLRGSGLFRGSACFNSYVVRIMLRILLAAAFFFIHADIKCQENALISNTIGCPLIDGEYLTICKPSAPAARLGKQWTLTGGNTKIVDGQIVPPPDAESVWHISPGNGGTVSVDLIPLAYIARGDVDADKL